MANQAVPSLSRRRRGSHRRIGGSSVGWATVPARTFSRSSRRALLPPTALVSCASGIQKDRCQDDQGAEDGEPDRDGLTIKVSGGPNGCTSEGRHRGHEASKPCYGQRDSNDVKGGHPRFRLEFIKLWA